MQVAQAEMYDRPSKHRAQSNFYAGDEKLPTCGRCERSGRWCDRTAPLKIRAAKGAVKGDGKRSRGDVVDQDAAGVSDEGPVEMLQSDEIAWCFEHYLKVLAPWYDLNDFDNSFRGVVGQMALRSRLLLSAIVAFAAIHGSKTGRVGLRPLAESYHVRCLHLLIALDESDTAITDGTALAATCLLRSYEILAGE
jgi:hypothetical protein